MPSGRLCLGCKSARPVLKRPKTGDALCKECFFTSFEKEIHETITRGHIFRPGMKVAIGASGGKDSTVLVHTLKTLNERHSYGLDLFLLSIDEGITGYREDSLETVKTNQSDYGLPLKILSYKDLYGWTMDEIVQMAGRKNNCTFCGVFRRQALERGAALLGCDMIATGHNADDVAETVLMNLLRGDIARLHRSISVVTETKGSSSGSENLIPRCKPFKYTYEKEIVLYAYFKKLLYFSTECTYAPFSYRGFARTFLKDLESIRPRAIIDIIHSAEQLVTEDTVNLPTQRACLRCQFISSQEVCKACIILEGLKRGMPKLGVGKSSKAKRLLGSSAKSEEKKKTAPPSAPTSGETFSSSPFASSFSPSSTPQSSTPCSTCTCFSKKNE